MNNLCGKCNVCCIRFKINKSYLPWRDTDKKANEICDKLVNHRCVVYKTRPKQCKEYNCLWLQLRRWAIEFRPDKIGIIVSTTHDESGRFIFCVEELEKGRIDFSNLSPEVEMLLRNIFEIEKQQQGETLVIIYFFGKNKGYQITEGKY